MRMQAATRPHVRSSHRPGAGRLALRLDAEGLTAYVAVISVWGASIVAAGMWARVALAGS